MNRPLLLDLFCCEGGAATGYHQAGFDIIGIDINPQPNYPFDFVQADALDVLGSINDNWLQYDDNAGIIISAELAAIHASPPCQAYSVSTVMHRDTHTYPDLVPPVREYLIESFLPWIIENVPGSGLVETGATTFDGRHGTMLCGSMFGMERVQRHRLFETNWILNPPSPCRHHEQRDVMQIVGHGEQGRTGRVGPHWGLEARRKAMGMPWASREGIPEAIPPAYTEHIGRQLLDNTSSSA